MLKKILVLLGLGFSQTLLAALPPTITFATEATYPPFEYVAPSGEIKGFDIELAKALCQTLNVQCTFTNQPWQSLIPSLKLGKFDALISAMGITAERQQQVDFSQPYLPATASLVALASDHLQLTPASLEGKIVGVQGGATMEQYMNTVYKGVVTVKPYASLQDALLDLTSGRVDAVLGDTPSLVDWLNKHDTAKKYQLVGEPINDPQIFGAGYAIAVKKGHRELLDAFNKALATIKSNGSYDKLVDAYFPHTP
ncbi:MAG: lysine/arginine/ornithine ABC transporter substrate-binding protein [Gammaproteobacteria bacterium]